MIYLTNIDSVEPDQKMNQEKGFAAMELRWLLSGANAPVTLCTIGHTRKQKGGEHRLHHHLHADEVILMLHGKAIEVVGDERVELKKGDCLFIPRGVVHSHKVTEDPVETYCIYIGAGSIEKTGYVLDEK
jgi:mannose-6-phosphate isomerase-like protein (cupin superfamily)